MARLLPTVALIAISTDLSTAGDSPPTNGGDQKAPGALQPSRDEEARHEVGKARRTLATNEPIGSSVTEAAYKVIVNQQRCGSGMKWKEGTSAVVLSLRALSYTPERWGQVWSKVDRWGHPIAA